MRGRRRRRRGPGRPPNSSRPPVDGIVGCVDTDDVGVKVEQSVPRVRPGESPTGEEGRQPMPLPQPTSVLEAPVEDKPPLALRPYRQRRQRNIRFSYAENMTLITKLVPVYEQLLGGMKMRTPRSKKNQMWQHICDAVNRVGRRQRFIHHCKKRFHDIKKQLRTKLNRERTTGEQESPSPCNTWYTQYEEELKKVLPAEVIDGFEFFDSDQPQGTNLEPKPGPSWKLKFQDKDRDKQDASFSDFDASLDSEVEELPPQDRHPHTNPRAKALGSNKPSLKNVPQSSRAKPVNAKQRGSNFCHAIPQQRGKARIDALSPVSSPFKPFERMKAAQCLFRKSVLHNLKVLHWDIGQFNHSLDVNHEMAKRMLQVQTQKNDVLFQMSNNIDLLAEGIQHLANQRQADRVLLQDLLQVKRAT